MNIYLCLDHHYQHHRDMLFNSWEYALFLPIILALYWLVTRRNLALQNTMLLVASYSFYASWDYRFLALLLFSTSLDYIAGIQINKASTASQKKIWFWLSISINLGLLCFFKYYNFFIGNVTTLFGWQADPWLLKIILPLGISFYTFHGISYIIDTYKGRIKPTTNFIDYALFVSFFPLLIAGPIERATHLLPQIQSKRSFDKNQFITGLKQILWGLFKKMVIADNCAPMVNSIFADPAHQGTGNLLLGALLLPMQVYGDFSGYSDIAIGTAKLMGIDLLRNFAFPFFSRDMAEFWRRWHISLSTWFRDYVYIPLGGSRGSKLRTLLNVFITFGLCGLWHGANWTYIAFGLVNAAYFIPIVLLRTGKLNTGIVAQDRLLPSFMELVQMTYTFMLTALMMIFFRASSIHDAVAYISGIFGHFTITNTIKAQNPISLILLVFIAIEWLGRQREFAIADFGIALPRFVKWSLYYGIFLAIIFFAAHTQQKFVYFQF